MEKNKIEKNDSSGENGNINGFQCCIIHYIQIHYTIFENDQKLFVVACIVFFLQTLTIYIASHDTFYTQSQTSSRIKTKMKKGDRHSRYQLSVHLEIERRSTFCICYLLFHTQFSSRTNTQIYSGKILQKDHEIIDFFTIEEQVIVNRFTIAKNCSVMKKENGINRELVKCRQKQYLGIVLQLGILLSMKCNTHLKANLKLWSK